MWMFLVFIKILCENVSCFSYFRVTCFLKYAVAQKNGRTS